ncbi:MAG: hypothetical protein ACFFD2_29640 [Promethearchaeota archaeon]
MEDLIKELKNLQYIISEIAQNIKARSSSYQDLEDLEAIEKSQFVDVPIINKIKKLLELEKKITNNPNFSYSEKEIEEINNEIQEIQLYININFYQWLQFF